MDATQSLVQQTSKHQVEVAITPAFLNLHFPISSALISAGEVL